MSCSQVRSMKPCCMVYPTRASSSPCFLFFRPLIAASSGVRAYAPTGMSCSQVRSMKPCCMVYPTRASSSPCFLFFRPLIAASSGVRAYGGDMICSSLPIWPYIARISSFSPGNTNGGPGLHDCQMRSCATFQACQATVSSSVRKVSFKSFPGPFGLVCE